MRSGGARTRALTRGRKRENKPGLIGRLTHFTEVIKNIKRFFCTGAFNLYVLVGMRAVSVHVFARYTLLSRAYFPPAPIGVSADPRRIINRHRITVVG